MYAAVKNQLIILTNKHNEVDPIEIVAIRTGPTQIERVEIVVVEIVAMVAMVVVMATEVNTKGNNNTIIDNSMTIIDTIPLAPLVIEEADDYSRGGKSRRHLLRQRLKLKKIDVCS